MSWFENWRVDNTLIMKNELLWQRILVNSLFLILADTIIFVIAAYYLESYLIAFPLALIRMMALLALFPGSFFGFNMLFSSRVAPYVCTFILIYLILAVIGSFVNLGDEKIFEVFVGLHSRVEFYALSYLPFVISFCITYPLDFTMLDK